MIKENNYIKLKTALISGYELKEGSSAHLSLDDYELSFKTPQKIAPRVKSSLGIIRNHLNISR